MMSRSLSSYLDSTLAGDSLRMVLYTLALGQEEAVGHQGVDPFFYFEEEQQDEEKEVTTELVPSSLTVSTQEFKEQKRQEVKEQVKKLCPRHLVEQEKEQEVDGKSSDLAIGIHPLGLLQSSTTIETTYQKEEAGTKSGFLPPETLSIHKKSLLSFIPAKRKLKSNHVFSLVGRGG